MKRTLYMVGTILLLCIGFLAAKAPASARSSPVLPPHTPGEMLVRWRTDEGPRLEALPSSRRALQELGGERVGSIPQLGIERWRVPADRLQDALALLRRREDVLWAEPNYLLNVPDEPIHTFPARSEEGTPAQHLGTFIPNDPYYTSYSDTYLRPLGVETAWGITKGSPKVIVAVIDTGVDCEHEDLQGACWRNEDEIPDNGVDDDRNGYVDDVDGWNFPQDRPHPTDVHYHGTHVAGIIAARVNNGKGIAGMAGNVTIMPLAIFQPQGVGTYYDLIRAILYATDNGAQVINMSLGATSYSLGEAAAVRYAVEHGVTLVAAAGNLGVKRLFYPAAHPDVIAVSALRGSGDPAGFTNYGDYIDVAAPGVSIISTIPGNSYGAASGTSMAAPHVSGLAALLLSRNPTLSPADIRAYLRETASDGVGPPEQDTPGKDDYYGYGRIHAGNAVQQVPSRSGDPTHPPLPPTLPWTPTCEDVVLNGDFEKGETAWHVTGAEVVTSPVFSGTQALRFDPAGNGLVWQDLPSFGRPLRMTVSMAVRIETRDSGVGNTYTFPYDDWLEVTLEQAHGQNPIVLLRMGNSSDSVTYGLQWDQVLEILPAEDLAPLRSGTWRLTLRTGSDGDDAPTWFTVDAIRVCIIRPRFSWRFVYLP